MTERPDKAALRVGVVGLGQIGSGIAGHLQKAGLLAAIYDSDKGAIARAGLGGEVPVVDPLEMLQSCDVSIYAVAQTAQIAGCLHETAPAPGAIVVDVTTSDPSQAVCLAEMLGTRGVGYIDAPVAGGATAADDASLTLLIGADEELLKICSPILGVFSGRQVHLGPVGSGHAMKLIHNMILHSAFFATCEGLRVAERAGMDLNRVLDVLNASNARSFITDTRFPRDILSGTMNARCSLELLEKDLSLAMRFGRDNEAQQPFTALTLDMLRLATSRKNPSTDFAWLFPMFDELAKALPNARSA